MGRERAQGLLESRPPPPCLLSEVPGFLGPGFCSLGHTFSCRSQFLVEVQAGTLLALGGFA